ncbi:MAG: hypothetical protein K0B09_07050 [Bacteroidales bacterium]|nr:hypothetical protein [Bacteroidales bacterium]
MSGYKASLYSVVINEEKETLLEKFIRENKNSFLSETKDILKRLRTIGHKTGARKQFFKEFEGKPGDGICALYDDPDSKLRLYCIIFGAQILVVGGGGPKPKNIKALQENQKLKDENYFLRWLSEQITERIKDKEITFENDYLDFSGNLEFHEKED